MNILYAVLILTVLGGVFGLVLSIASKVFEVKSDPRPKGPADTVSEETDTHSSHNKEEEEEEE